MPAVLQAAGPRFPDITEEGGPGMLHVLGNLQSQGPGRGELILAVYASNGVLNARSRCALPHLT